MVDLLMDFTLKKYTQLLDAFLCSDYEFMTFEDYCFCAKELADKKLVIFRHDVDLKAENALQVAKIETEKGIRSTYYFRTLASSNKPNVIKQIVALGHEVGYHYEDFSFCNGDAEKAKHLFLKNLNYFRQFYPVKTICMHGSPRSRFDNKDLWKSFDYQSCGIVGEPYFDMDFDEFFYLTDTGRCWDGFLTSVRDKVPQQNDWKKKGLLYHSTDDVINALLENKFPHRLMLTTHPQRWTDSIFLWTKEFVFQNVKNQIKRWLVD